MDNFDKLMDMYERLSVYFLRTVEDNKRLREANGILEDALQEVGDDYPGSSCQEWCVQQVKRARAALGGDND